MNMTMNRSTKWSFKNTLLAMVMTALLGILVLPFGANQAHAALANGTYSVDYTVLADGTSNKSRLDSYVVKPATVTVANGVTKARITITSSSLITAFKVEQNGQLVDAAVVSTNTANNTRVVEFPVSNLDATLNAYAEIKIPVIGYTGKYNVDLKFDSASAE
ncbi:NEAT domain-containing protein [Paenibacillus wulumuqiensis]|uniref:NEAT domain-containing protein n=1 Tax=Paenibacillus wulumuqiensis TaxID=1567107 RepID=UPI00061962AE|nr:NEAT domain-containing protein [Paenibacillus wulumuqiensis]